MNGVVAKFELRRRRWVSWRLGIFRAAGAAWALLLLALPTVAASEPDEAVLAAEQARVEISAKISAPTIAIFSSNGSGGGSGVIISEDGFALTNFHVTAPTGPAMKVGLADGRYVDAVLVGLDPGGDVALIKLLGSEKFPTATMGDSDDCRVGQWVYVAGNPFLLADDFKPTITYGILSGVRRYQFPAGTLLEYADCLQTDAAINPGNSGGPMFNANGELIGINGRGSFEKRGRVNVGVGYAISINQIKRFIGLLKSGRFVDHASLGATVASDSDGRVVVDDILESSDAFRRGLRYGDELLQFAGREIDSANAFKNALGTLPADWRVPLTYRRDGKEYEIQVRLAGVHRQGELEALLDAEKERPQPRPREQPEPGDEPKPEGPRRQARPGERSVVPKDVRKYWEAAPGYANYWFNRYHQQRIWNAYLAKGDFADTGWNWKIKARIANTDRPVEITLDEKGGTVIMPDGESAVEFGPTLMNATGPPRSGGLLAALHVWQRLLLVGPRRFGEVVYLGPLPWKTEDSLADCLVATHGGVETRFYFDLEKSHLVGIEFFATEGEDPCEITLSDNRTVEGRALPHRWTIRLGDETFADLVLDSIEIGKADPKSSSKIPPATTEQEK